jgi:hypothetical protein
MNKEQAVQLSNQVAQCHAEWGGCVLCLDGGIAQMRFPDLSLLQWGEAVDVPGRALLPKQNVRALLWERRHVLKELGLRPTAVIWSVYDEGSDTSSIGLGVMVAPSPALRERYAIAE